MAFPLLAPQRGLIATDTQTGVVPSWPNQELLTNQQHAASCMVPTGKIMNGKDPLQELSNCGSPPAEPGVYLEAITGRPSDAMGLGVGTQRNPQEAENLPLQVG